MPLATAADALLSRATDALSRQEEQVLFARYRAGDAAAGDRLVRSYLRYVRGFCQTKLRKAGRVDDLDEVMGAAGLAIATQLPRFDVARGTRFITYLTPMLHALVGDALARSSSPVSGWTGSHGGLRAVLAKLRREHGSFPPEAAILTAARALKQPPARLRARLAATRRGVRASLREEGDDATSDGVVLVDATARPDARVEAARDGAARAARIEVAMDVLTPREAQVVRLRVLTTEEPPPTLATVASLCGFSRERARQLEERALRKLAVHLAEYAPGASEAGDCRAASPPDIAAILARAVARTVAECPGRVGARRRAQRYATGDALAAGLAPPLPAEVSACLRAAYEAHDAHADGEQGRPGDHPERPHDGLAELRPRRRADRALQLAVGL